MFFPSTRFGFGIVDSGVKGKFRFGSRIAYGPAREAARHFDHVLLRVAAVHSQSVQLHQLPPVVFVEPAVGHWR